MQTSPDPYAALREWWHTPAPQPESDPNAPLRSQVERLLEMGKDERKQHLQARTVRHMKHSDDEMGYYLYLLYSQAYLHGMSVVLDAGPRRPGRPRAPRPATSPSGQTL